MSLQIVLPALRAFLQLAQGALLELTKLEMFKGGFEQCPEQHTQSGSGIAQKQFKKTEANTQMI